MTLFTSVGNHGSLPKVKVYRITPECVTNAYAIPIASEGVMVASGHYPKLGPNEQRKMEFGKGRQ